MTSLLDKNKNALPTDGIEKHAKYKDDLEKAGAKSTKRTKNYNKDLV